MHGFLCAFVCKLQCHDNSPQKASFTDWNYRRWQNYWSAETGNLSEGEKEVGEINHALKSFEYGKIGFSEINVILKKPLEET